MKKGGKRIVQSETEREMLKVWLNFRVISHANKLGILSTTTVKMHETFAAMIFENYENKRENPLSLY